ncbi:hypothetical protein FCJ60_25985 [Burkholderia metallica]|nr:hypothetical protein [Burkholderia metallica]
MARRCLDARIRGFTEFEGFCTGRFRPGTQSFKSAMFTNFITPAKGRTRFYHCLYAPSSFAVSRRAGPAARRGAVVPRSTRPNANPDNAIDTRRPDRSRIRRRAPYIPTMKGFDFT